MRRRTRPPRGCTGMPVLTGGATSVVLSLLCFDIVTQRASYSSADVIWMVSVIPVLDVSCHRAPVLS